YLAKRQFAPAIEELRTTARLSGGQLDLVAVLGLAYAEAGRRAEARKLLKTLERASQQRPDLSHSIALVLAGLGEKDQAFGRLEQAYQAHDGSLILLQVNPLLDSLRSDARVVVQELTDDQTLPKTERKRLQIEHARLASQRAQVIKVADKICNVLDVTYSPPANWSTQRRREYLDWTERVVAGCRDCNHA